MLTFQSIDRDKVYKVICVVCATSGAINMNKYLQSKPSEFFKSYKTSIYVLCAQRRHRAVWLMQIAEMLSLSWIFSAVGRPAAALVFARIQRKHSFKDTAPDFNVAENWTPQFSSRHHFVIFLYSTVNNCEFQTSYRGNCGIWRQYCGLTKIRERILE